MRKRNLRKVTVNGDAYDVTPLDSANVRPGTLLTALFGHKAMRVVCLDGDDAILRNLRYPDLIEVEPISTLPEYYASISAVKP